MSGDGAIHTDEAAPQLVAKGALVGMAEAVPGVSGSSIALMSGIYPHLIATLRQFDLHLLRAALGLRLAQVWTMLDWRFLLLLCLGMFPGLWLSARGLGWALEQARPAVMAAFVGLLTVGALLALRAETRRNLRLVLALAGAASGVAITALLSWLDGLDVQVPLTLAGAFGGVAMLLPGISGSFVLLSLGSYERVIEAVATLDFWVLGQVALGAVLGGLLCIRLIHRTYSLYRGALTTAMGGLMLGVLPVLWPWRSPDTGAWHSPAGYAAGEMGADPMLALCALGLALGGAIGLGISAMAGRRFAQPD